MERQPLHAENKIVATEGQDQIVLGVLDDFIGMYMRAAYEASYRDFTDRLGADALKPGYFTILTLIVNNPGIGQTQISQTARRDKSSVTKALRWMEEAGLIIRIRPNSDRRTHLSEATRKGRELQARLEVGCREHLSVLTATLGDRGQDFVAMLKEIVAALPDAASRSS